MAGLPFEACLLYAGGIMRMTRVEDVDVLAASLEDEDKLKEGGE